MTVRAIGAVAVQLNPSSTVTDWAFTSEHPVLWRFAPHTTMYINGPFDVTELLARLMARRMPFVGRSDLLKFFDPAWTPVSPRGLSLPPQLHNAACEELHRMNVPTFVPHGPSAPPDLTLFLMDGTDYVVAEDFEIDVPDFRHELSWFNPASSGAAG